MEERLRLVRIEKYGPGSEKLSDAQLELLELEPGVSSAEVKAESERDQLKLPLKPRRKHPGRQELPANLTRVEKIIACTPEQCVCGNCGKENSVIGYEKSEQLDVKPAEYFVAVTMREKRACKACEEQGVECAAVPVRIIEKGLASDRVVIDTVVSKYADHLPLFRQSAILLRETGIDLSRATLDGWVMRVGDLLRPITAAMGQELVSGTYIQADETTVGVQMHDNRGKNHQAYLWQYSRAGWPSGEEYQSNLQRVKTNAVAWSPERCRGPAREGTALLQGLAICGTCGERMSVRYHSHRNQSVPTYWCGRRPLQRGESGLCQTVHGGALDGAISDIVIEAMTPLAIEVALTVQQELATRHKEADRLRRQHVERARYEADLAQRRFLKVDPDMVRNKRISRPTARSTSTTLYTGSRGLPPIR